MTGALNSGKDLIIQVGAGYVERILRARLEALDLGCLEARDVEITYEGNPIVLDVVRRAIIDVDHVSFSHALAVDVITSVSLEVQLRLVYAQVLYRPLFGETYKTLDELGIQPADRLFPITLRVEVAAELNRVVLIFTLADTPDFLPEGVADTFTSRIPIPIDFLTQTQVFQDLEGVEHVVSLLTATLNEAEIKSVAGGNLAIGIDLVLTQDADLQVLGPEVSRDVSPIIAGPNDLVRHDCGLPDQPVITNEDVARFRAEFAESILEDSDWAVALDKHVVDAMLRGLPSADMADEGEAGVGFCLAENAVRGFCLRVTDLDDDDVIRVRGSGEVFICPVPEALGPLQALYNDFWEVCIGADVTLGFTDSGRLRAHYDVTSVRPCGDDAGFQVWVDLFGVDLLDQVPSRFRSRDLVLSSVPTSIGDSGDPAGRLTIDHVRVRGDALVLRGTGSIRTPRKALDLPPLLRFATGCRALGEPSSATMTIRNVGAGAVRVCPVVLRSHPRFDAADVEFFRVVSPPELLEAGEGLVLGARDSVQITIECSGDPGTAHYAVLDVPNTAGPATVPLLADFRPATLGATVEELRVEQEFVKAGCHWPFYRTLSVDLEVLNEGPGNMEICRLRFSQNIRAVFRASNPGVFGPGPAVVTVTFEPLLGDDTEYDGTLTLTTNSGESREVRVVGHHEYRLDWLTDRLSGSYELEIFCGDADWDRIQDHGGLIIDEPELAEFLDSLGGADCCPPPRGPACLCVDLLEATVLGVPRDVKLELVGADGQPVIVNQSRSAERHVLSPVKVGSAYSLRARLPQRVDAGATSRLMLRRWIVQQEGAYASSQRLSGAAIVDDRLFLAGDHGIETISLDDPRQLTRVGFTRVAGGSRSVASVGAVLVSAQHALTVYTIESGALAPTTRALSVRDHVRVVVAPHNPSHLPLAYAIGASVQTLDLRDPKHPRIGAVVPTRMPATSAVADGGHLYVIGSAGVEVFDLSMPERPRAVHFFAAHHPISHGLLAGTTLVLLSESRPADLIDISNPAKPKQVGAWRLEESIRPFVPSAGPVLTYGKHFVVLQGDRGGARLMRLRRNQVNTRHVLARRASRWSRQGDGIQRRGSA